MSFQPFEIRRAGFVSTRIAGTDGVSLEIEKWAHVIEELGIECYYITGESDRPAERTAIIEESHFRYPTILDITRRAFGTERRDLNLTDDIMDMSRLIDRKLAEAIRDFELDGIMAENSLTIPMNIPLGIALVSQIQQSEIGCLAHHHDFYWERDRFLVNCVGDFVRYAFPPALPDVQHVVINSLAGEEFSRRTGMSCRIIPNVMDFSNPPEPPDDYALQFRRAIGLSEDDILVLQPTRVVPRKGIEHTLELARRVDRERAKVVITHASGDEGEEYATRLREFAHLLGVELIFASTLINDNRGTGDAGQKLFTIHDAYQNADLVAYPSDYEGFGNAFLEAIYFKRPVVCNRYLIYRMDIEPLGFRTIVFDGFLTGRTIEDVQRVMIDEAYRAEMVDHNYEVASRFFGYDVLRDELQLMLRRPQNIYRLVGKGITGQSGQGGYATVTLE